MKPSNPFVEESSDASEFPGVTRRQINAQAWASQAHRLVKVPPRCERCGWVMTEIEYKGRKVWAWDYTKPKVLEPLLSAEQLCPDCDPG